MHCNRIHRRQPLTLWKGLWGFVVMVCFATIASVPANASMILAGPDCSTERYHAGLLDWDSESWGGACGSIASARQLPSSEPDSPEPLRMAVRFFGEEVVPVSTNMSGSSSSGAPTNGGAQAFAVLPDSTLAPPSALLLSWLAIEQTLDVPPAPAVELSRPPQTII